MSSRDQTLPPGPVLRLPPSRAPEVGAVLCEAFHDYPVMRFVLGPSGGDYDLRLRRLVDFFVVARVLRDEPLLGADLRLGPDERTLAGAALVSFPGERESPAELVERREELWAELGPAPRDRYEACGRTWAPLLEVDVPHIHLNMIGVRPAFAGRGVGRRLLERVHRLSRERPSSRGVTLTTEDPSNVPLYEHMGYEVLGHARIAPGLETWSLLRRD